MPELGAAVMREFLLTMMIVKQDANQVAKKISDSH